MAKIDFTRPFGEVYGQAGHCYEQDGKAFDSLGDEVAPEQESAAPVVAEQQRPVRKYTKRAAAPEPASPVDGELAAQMQG